MIKINEIKINEILNIPVEKLGDYNVHLACFNEDHEPLDVFLRDEEEY